MPEGENSKKVGELKESLSARTEPDNPVVHREAVVLGAKYSGDHTIDQIASIYEYLKNGDDSKRGWSYVPDPRGIDYFMYANETIKIGKRWDAQVLVTATILPSSWLHWWNPWAGPRELF